MQLDIKKEKDMSTTATNTYCADILRSLGAISDNESALARVAKYVRRVVKEQENDPSLMTEEEYFAMLDRSEEEALQGKVHKMLPDESLDDFLKRVS